MEEKKKTALVLSGGGSRGAYEIGAWKALKEMGYEFDMVVGTSIGAMNAFVLVQGKEKLAEEFWLKLKTDEVFDYKNALANKGVKFTSIKDVLIENFNETDARASKTELGVVTVKAPSMEPVYMWMDDCPEGELLDYVLASCTCTPVVSPYEIHGEKYVDGGFYDYMPISMVMDRGVDEIVAINVHAIGVMQKQAIKAAGRKLTVVRTRWDLGSFANFDPEHSRHIMRLGYLDTMKVFGRYEGFKYTFEKGELSWRDWEMADSAALMFDLPNEVVYSYASFVETMKDAVDIYRRLGGSAKQKAFAAVCDSLKKGDEGQKSIFDRLPKILTTDAVDAARWMIEHDLY